MNQIKYVGLDVHKETISIAVMTGKNFKPDFEKTITSDNKQILKFFKKLGNPENILSCYEGRSL